ncbi:hypothetical protein PsYK624_115220 [Phanerochaete sordida]|uniref:F-box domain-containing protein n=1 Tax=Phanerochaete sordida TaxID=48140 RepID=A0A9P3LHT6_9APHY|nr:hypothetical protein PsYK624_115220 [Phanerochaete sordida]
MKPLAVPQEMVDYIIDTLSLNPTPREDRHGLASCSLVCRAWSYRASRHLLKHVDVLALRLKRFMTMASTSARYRAYTEDISILGSIEMSDHWNRLFAAVPRLSSLEIWSNSAEFSYTILDPTIARLRSLEKLSVHCAEWRTLQFFLYTFLHVETLSLRSIAGPCDWVNHRNEHVLRAAPMTVGKLIVEMFSGDNAPFPSLYFLVRTTSLSVTNFDVKNIPAISDFLHHAREDIVHVELAPTHEARVARNGAAQGFTVDLSGLAGCDKIITIALIVVDVAWAVDLVRAVLSHMPATIKHLRITLARGQWHDILQLLGTCLGARRDKYLKLDQLELTGLGAEAVSEYEARQLLADMQSEVESHLPPRYRAVVTVRR